MELQHTSQKNSRENVQVMEHGFLDKETQEPEQKFMSTSEHIPHPSSELRGHDDKTSNKCSMLNPAENDIKENFISLSPHKNKQECILNVPKHKLIINENDLEVRVDRSACSYSQVWRGKGILGQDRKRKVHLLSADLIDLMQTINKKGRNRQATYAWWALPMWLSCSSPSVAQVQLRWMPSSVIYLWNYIALPEVTFYVYLISQIPTVEAEVTSSQMATFLTLIHINGREDEEKYL